MGSANVRAPVLKDIVAAGHQPGLLKRLDRKLDGSLIATQPGRDLALGGSRWLWV